MPNPSLCVKVPGKLMIAGEYAVLEQHQKLVVMAVDRFVYATIKRSDENHLTLENFKLNNIKWNYTNRAVNMDLNDERIRFVKEAMTIVLNYLNEKSITPSPFTLSIKSELDDESGIKYGLGSSAAVVTAVVTAILKMYLNENPSPELIFKLAAISHVNTQGNGSGADVAASSYGGILQYASFQADWLKREYANRNTLIDLLEQKWTYLSIKQIELPKDIFMCIGWTGKPASTEKLVDKILKLKTDNRLQYEQFLANSDIAVHMLLRGITEVDLTLLLEGMNQNRRALAILGENAGVEIETPLLRKLSNLAVMFAGAGKPSGAGGGDCGIALVPSKENAGKLLQAWESVGIKPLTIEVYPVGAELF